MQLFKAILSVGLALLLLGLIPLLLATTTVTTYNQYPIKWVHTVEAGPAVIPSSPETLSATQTWWVEEAAFNNPTGASTQVITMTCNSQAFISVSIAAGSNYLMEFTGRKCPAPIAWSVDGGTSVIGYLRAKW